MKLDKPDLSMNDRLILAGVKTIRDGKIIELEYNGNRIKRPHVDNCVEYCLIYLGVEI